MFWKKKKKTNLAFHGEGPRRYPIENGCPNCGSHEFYKGPSAGIATNVKCADCGKKYNTCMGLFVGEITPTGYIDLLEDKDDNRIDKPDKEV